MNFSKTTEYAFRILSYMAMDERKLYISRDIHNDLQIPFRYLRKQLTSLSKSELIHSVQGKNGGYMISKPLEDISLIDIMDAVGDNNLESSCFFGFQTCALKEKCTMHTKWALVLKSIKDVLTTTSLAELKESGPHSFISNNNLLFTKN